MFIDPYLANVTIFAGNFAPRSWMFCWGQLLSIAEYDALFSLIGTTYGGDGQTTFALPDLRSRIAVHTGTGAGLDTIVLGQLAGTENVSLLSNNLPGHTHPVISTTGNMPVSSNAGTLSTPAGNVPALFAGGNLYNTTGTGNMGATPVNANSGIAGQSLPFSIGAPALALNYIIAVEGIYPSRN